MVVVLPPCTLFSMFAWEICRSIWVVFISVFCLTFARSHVALELEHVREFEPAVLNKKIKKKFWYNYSHKVREPESIFWLHFFIFWLLSVFFGNKPAVETESARACKNLTPSPLACARVTVAHHDFGVSSHQKKFKLNLFNHSSIKKY